MNDRWRVTLTLNGKIKKDLRNKTGLQLRRIRSEWAKNKKNADSEYFNTELHYNAETDLRSK